VGWNLLESFGVSEDLAGGFGVRNYTIGYSVARQLIKLTYKLLLIINLLLTYYTVGFHRPVVQACCSEEVERYCSKLTTALLAL